MTPKDFEKLDGITQSLMVATYEAHGQIEAIMAKESSDKAKGANAPPPGTRQARSQAATED